MILEHNNVSCAQCNGKDGDHFSGCPTVTHPLGT